MMLILGESLCKTFFTILGIPTNKKLHLYFSGDRVRMSLNLGEQTIDVDLNVMSLAPPVFR